LLKNIGLGDEDYHSNNFSFHGECRSDWI